MESLKQAGHSPSRRLHQKMADDGFSKSLRRSGSSKGSDGGSGGSGSPSIGGAWSSMKNMMNSPPRRGLDGISTTVLDSEGANPMATLDAGVEMMDAGWGQDAVANEAMVQGMHGPNSTKVRSCARATPTHAAPAPSPAPARAPVPALLLLAPEATSTSSNSLRALSS